jgi:mRNA interferase MazF
MVAVITGNTLLARAPGNVMLTRRQSGLSKDSSVNVSQVATFDRRVLTEQVSTLPSQLLSAVDAGLRLSLGL